MAPLKDLELIGSATGATASATAASTGRPAVWATSMIPAISPSVSSTERRRFFRLCVSLAETTASISSAPAATARSAPRRLGASAA